jgi:hypothetical protein
MRVVPSAAIPARTRATSALKSVANIGALYSGLHPAKCNKLTTVVNKDMSCGCKSVGNPGYGSVITSMFLSSYGELICKHMTKPFDHYILGTSNAKANEKMNERCMNCWKAST